MNVQPNPDRPARRRRTPRNAPRFLTVRMYDVGFGDCFLLTIPQTGGGALKILFDCGSIKLGEHSQSIQQVVQQVIQDVRGTNGEPPRIDVLVATHRHKDHILGFDNPAWDEVEVGEVWLPWTEDPQDAQAQSLREMHARLAASLAGSLNPDDRGMASAYAMAVNALSNDDAMRRLTQDGFAGQPLRRYLPVQYAARNWFTTPVLPGVTIHVLGPSRDPEVITELDPPAGQSYLKRIAAGAEDGRTPVRNPLPFRPGWMVQPEDYRTLHASLDQDIPEDDREAIRNASFGLEDEAASALDKALNGTSLVLVIQTGSVALLFPGDAQWGTWHLALNDAASRKLLETVDFYKVGHHGSHNANPVEFIEQLLGKGGKSVTSLISVNPTRNWPLVPKPELVEELRHKQNCKVARSDEPEAAAEAGFTVVDNRVIETRLPF